MINVIWKTADTIDNTVALILQKDTKKKDERITESISDMLSRLIYQKAWKWYVES